MSDQAGLEKQMRDTQQEQIKTAFDKNGVKGVPNHNFLSFICFGKPTLYLHVRISSFVIGMKGLI